jgi:pimeloyl-ACP methyl ester carboxylesterase
MRKHRRMNLAEAWRDKGRYFSWSPASGDAPSVNIFHVELGDPDAPAIVLVHGFPTSSVDWIKVGERLSKQYRVCAMDFPGYGFSDKPMGWGYSLFRDAEVLEYYMAEVLGLESAIMYAHDRGSSVAMIHTTAIESRVEKPHLFLTNANICLPMSNLTEAQRVMLDPERGPAALAAATPQQLAAGMGQTTFSPARAADDPEVEALTTIFEYGGGLPVIHETIQYLVERSQFEESWLEALAKLDLPTTFIWGVYDTVSPPRVVNYVWNHYMMFKPGENSLYYVPDANHYMQNDQPDAVVEVIAHALTAPPDSPPGALSPRSASPLLVDRSRRELSKAADLLTKPE